MRLAAALDNEDPGVLEDAVRVLRSKAETPNFPKYAVTPGVVNFEAHRGADLWPHLERWRELETPRQTAHVVLEQLLEGNLNVFRRVRAMATAGHLADHLRSAFEPINLVSAIYWLLADAATGRKVRNCAHCGRAFIAYDERARYCPRPMGEQGDSVCLNRERQKRFRERLVRTRRGRRRVAAAGRRKR
jgi:hypothetical protein